MTWILEGVQLSVLQLAMATYRLVELLVAYGANVLTRDSKGNTPLFNLFDHSKNEDVHMKKLAEFLISKGAEFGPTESQHGGIMCTAARLGWNSILKSAIVKGCNVDAKDAYGQIPLIWAICRGPASSVKLLLDKGANATAPLDLEQLEDLKKGGTLLGVVVQRRNAEMVRLLLPTGLQHSNINQLMMIVATNNSKAVVEVFLQAGADFHHKTAKRMTLLMAALSCSQWSDKEAVETATYLIEQGADPLEDDMFGRTPLYMAVYGGYFLTLQLLVSIGVDVHSRICIGTMENPHIRNYDGTLLHLAAGKNQYRSAKNQMIIQELVNLGVGLEDRNNQGETACILPFENGTIQESKLW